ncbi:hypothetical protein BpHYR1_019048 [Brachionus plicatilis]|uniref:Uncharacterized protein n=1 Tax=Brachionus plicatilis TaxID=10195 RepID=A0A3M7P5B7_BRAPC|nr:hypothetical protein BpHYR1_019048 [Brachionus plicatilis]
MRFFISYYIKKRTRNFAEIVAWMTVGFYEEKKDQKKFIIFDEIFVLNSSYLNTVDKITWLWKY